MCEHLAKERDGDKEKERDTACEDLAKERDEDKERERDRERTRVR